LPHPNRKILAENFIPVSDQIQGKAIFHEEIYHISPISARNNSRRSRAIFYAVKSAAYGNIPFRHPYCSMRLITAEIKMQKQRPERGKIMKKLLSGVLVVWFIMGFALVSGIHAPAVASDVHPMCWAGYCPDMSKPNSFAAKRSAEPKRGDPADPPVPEKYIQGPSTPVPMGTVGGASGG
jgi:hypothetical protein